MQPSVGFPFKVVKWETCKGQRLPRVYQSGSWLLYLASRGTDSGGLTHRVMACWACCTPMAWGIERGREGLREKSKEQEVLGLGHVPWWASMLHLSCAQTWNYGLMGFSAPWPPRLSGLLWEMWGQPSALQQGNFTFSHCFSAVMALLQLPYIVMSPRQDLMVLHIYELSRKPIMFITVIHGSTVWCIHWTTRLDVFCWWRFALIKVLLTTITSYNLYPPIFNKLPSYLQKDSSGHWTKKEPPWISFFFFRLPSRFPSPIDFPTTLRSSKMPPTRTWGCKHCFVSLARYGEKEG